MNPFTDKIISRNEGIVFNKLDDELVMMSIENGEYYGLDNIGAQIWEIIQQPTNFSEIVLKLMRKYDVSEETCIADIQEFLSELLGKNLITLK